MTSVFISYISIIRLSFLNNGKRSKYASPLFQRRVFYVKWFKYSHCGTVMEIAKDSQKHSQGYEFYLLAKDMETYQCRELAVHSQLKAKVSRIFKVLSEMSSCHWFYPCRKFWLWVEPRLSHWEGRCITFWKLWLSIFPLTRL